MAHDTPTWRQGRTTHAALPRESGLTHPHRTPKERGRLGASFQAVNPKQPFHDRSQTGSRTVAKTPSMVTDEIDASSRITLASPRAAGRRIRCGERAAGADDA